MLSMDMVKLLSPLLKHLVLKKNKKFATMSVVFEIKDFSVSLLIFLAFDSFVQHKRWICVAFNQPVFNIQRHSQLT